MKEIFFKQIPMMYPSLRINVENDLRLFQEFKGMAGEIPPEDDSNIGKLLRVLREIREQADVDGTI